MYTLPFTTTGGTNLAKVPVSSRDCTCRLFHSSWVGLVCVQGTQHSGNDSVVGVLTDGHGCPQDSRRVCASVT